MYSLRKASTKILFCGTSRSCAHCAVLYMPSMGSPTAWITSSSAEKPGPISLTLCDRPADTNCLTKLMPMPPGRKM
ncbi:hypothetical protein D3C86_1423440 [compost metagenome]